MAHEQGGDEALVVDADRVAELRQTGAVEAFGDGYHELALPGVGLLEDDTLLLFSSGEGVLLPCMGERREGTGKSP